MIFFAGSRQFSMDINGTMQQAERGFRAERVAMMTVSAGAAYPRPPEVLSFYNRFLEKIRARPGHSSAYRALPRLPGRGARRAAGCRPGW